MKWHNWIDPAQVVGGYATAFAAGVAFAALLAAGAQLWLSQKVSREAGAIQAYREYLRLCFDNPDFSSYYMFEKAHPSGIDLIKAGGLSAASEKYLWFVSILLSTCEEVLLNVSSEGGWRSSLVAQLSYHGRTLEIIWPD